VPRRLKQDERFMRWAQERSQLLLTLRNATIPEKLRAYKQLEKRILKEARSDGEKREMQRRISMDLLMAASDGSWRGFSPYLRRLERLGYTSMFDRLLACVLAAEAARGSPAGVRKAVSLIAEIERRLCGRKLHPGVREEFEGGLARARKFLGLEARSSLRGRH
jgi:hypothetical protein